MKFKKTLCCFIISLFTLSLLSSQKVMSKENKNTSCNIIYLTFDDGPSSEVTGKILDILKEKNIKATFFLIGYKIKGNEATVKRINSEGHSIGLHTFTHDYGKIYKNNQAFKNEIQQNEAAIKNVIGNSSKIIRFPSGSKGHMTSDLYNELHSKGYNIFDWNICLSDGINHNTPVNTLYKEGTKECINPSRIFLLAHCSGNNQNTCTVLPKIIDYYKSKGYKFLPITDNTPEYHFRIPKK